ncbi:MAG TPA: alpha/beta hydrolase [Polymorphobacter sp.]|nr:alpha/beta hydrolase [Polymorphobacter sp.]
MSDAPAITGSPDAPAAAGKPPLYFIHGMWSTPAVWAGLRARFEAAGYTTHAACLPYHDRDPSLPPVPELGKLGVQDYVDYLVADIARLPQTPIIIGHSLGGFLAQAVATRIQPPALVLLSPAPSAKTSVLALNSLRAMWGVIRHWGWWKSPTLLDDAGARFGVYNGVPTDVADAEIKALVWDSGRVLFELSLPGVAKAPAATIDFSRLTMPVLIIVGANDQITTAAVARATARAIGSTVDYHELPDAGHWLFHGATVAKVGDLVAGWLGQRPV